MATVDQRLLRALEGLDEEDFKTFKFHLKTPGPHNDFCEIPLSHLQTANKCETVDLVMGKYVQRAVEVCGTVLSMVGRYDLKEQLWESCPDAVSASPEQIVLYQDKLQSYLGPMYRSLREGTAAPVDQNLLVDIFTELFITAGGDVHINKQHEVMQIDVAKGAVAEDEKTITPSEIFKDPTGKRQRIRTVLTNGVAGIGKTVLVKKFVLDWAEKRTNQDVHLLFPLTFRELNELKGRSFSLAELIQECVWEAKAIKTQKLNDIFTKLQESGNRDYDTSEFRLVFVLDGLDESRFDLDFDRSEDLPIHSDVTQQTSVAVLVTELIKGTLLPCARIWITTRPAAASKIPTELISSMSEVRGFNDAQKVEYFQKKFQVEEQSSRIISHIRSSRSLFIMCYIPVFCWITATVLTDVLKTSEQVELPKTLTDMYTQLLLYQMRKTEEISKKKICNRDILSLAKLAYRQLKGSPNFNEKDLKDSGITFHTARNYVGLFTDVFQQVKPLNSKKECRQFSFVHLSIQEYMAALYVVMSLVNDNKNVMSEPQRVLTLCKEHTLTDVHLVAIRQALESDGRLDLFLRFLMGLSMQNNQDLLTGILRRGKGKRGRIVPTNQKTIKFIQERIDENIPPERKINLFYCLSELKDDSLLKQIQQYLRSGSLATHRLPPALWAALVFFLLSSEETLQSFDLKTYSASEEGLLKLLPVVKASSKSLLNGCSLSDRSCEALASVLSSQSSNLRELDLSDNELGDSGVKLLSAGLANPLCALQALRLSACMITEEGCRYLASALRSNPSHLRELDLSYNHPGESGVMMLSAGQKDEDWKLDVLNLQHIGEKRLRPGLKKYVCDLRLDRNTAHTNLHVSTDRMEVTATAAKQPYPPHRDRFDCWLQVLCSDGLTGRCYWEVQWMGKAYIGVTYQGIRRKNEGTDGCLGKSDKSWSLLIDDDGSYSVRHKDITTPIVTPRPSACQKVAVFLDHPAGTLSFYEVTDTTLNILHTFHCSFSEPLYPAFGFGFGNNYSCFGSSVSLREVDSFSTRL